MTLKIGINGFGRIGRMVLRSIIENKRKDIEVVAINNRSNAKVSSFLLTHDTIHGSLKNKINYSDRSISVDGKKINMIQESEISNIDWKKHKVDMVLECTGKFNSKEKSAQHLKSGAKKVLVSAPCKGANNIVFGGGFSFRLMSLGKTCYSKKSQPFTSLTPILRSRGQTDN